ncbi:hypothetical protein B0H13DRAFT_1634689 [Mycena leptocephala]|nr:hypothetical protein B0H13DRAFT_1634689 [Mycena leptocephala]
MDQVSPLVAREGASPPWQVPIIAHAFCCVLAFALFLPGGAIFARYLRIFRPWWYTAHWIVQFATAGPLIVIGISLGFFADHELGGTPLDNHKRTGIVLFVLYISQCVIGAVIHYLKPKGARRRPIQNYFHAVFGLVILALGMYQIRTGYSQEWPAYMDYGRLPNWVNTLWIVWCFVLIMTYTGGLYFLRRQYTQEANTRAHTDHIILGALEAQRTVDFKSTF